MLTWQFNLRSTLVTQPCPVVVEGSGRLGAWEAGSLAPVLAPSVMGISCHRRPVACSFRWKVGERAAEVLVTDITDGTRSQSGEMTDVNMAAERLCLWVHTRHLRGCPGRLGSVSALSPSRVMSRSINASVSAYKTDRRLWEG